MITLFIVALLANLRVPALGSLAIRCLSALLARTRKISLGGFSFAPAAFDMLGSNIGEANRFLFSALATEPPVKPFTGLPAI